MQDNVFEEKKAAFVERMNAIKGNKKQQKLIQYLNWIITGATYIGYPIFIITLLIYRQPIAARALIVPLDAFVILSVVRLFINRKRPYEVYDCKSAIAKKTEGKSFPSRHVFCIFVIATTMVMVGIQQIQAPLHIFFYFGIALYLLGVALAWIRVYSGVHFLSDVIVGAIVGIASGMIGFLI